MRYNELYENVLKETSKNDPDTNFFAFAPKELQDFREKVFKDGRYPTSKSYEILWRPNKLDLIDGCTSQGARFPKEFDLNAFYKATTIPLKEYGSYALSSGLSPMIDLNVYEGPYKNFLRPGGSNRTTYYGIFPPDYLLKRSLNPDTLKTLEDLINEL